MQSFTIGSASTASSYTGPSSAFSGSYYAYAETSSPYYPSVKFQMNKYYAFDVREVTFAYSMYGSTMGELRLEASSTCSESPTTLWTKVGGGYYLPPTRRLAVTLTLALLRGR